MNLVNTSYAGQRITCRSGNAYDVSVDGIASSVVWPDVADFIALGFANAAVAALVPISVTSPPTATLEDAVTAINDIIAALKS